MLEMRLPAGLLQAGHGDPIVLRDVTADAAWMPGSSPGMTVTETISGCEGLAEAVEEASFSMVSVKGLSVERLRPCGCLSRNGRIARPHLQLGDQAGLEIAPMLARPAMPSR